MSKIPDSVGILLNFSDATTKCQNKITDATTKYKNNIIDSITKY